MAMSEARWPAPSAEEIESLKRDWELDPCWDIETTEGFEAHRDELLAHRKKCEERWEKAREEQQAERDRKALALVAELGFEGHLPLGRHLLGLSGRIEALEARLAQAAEKLGRRLGDE